MIYIYIVIVFVYMKYNIPSSSIYNYQYNKIRSAHRITYSVIVYIRIQLHITDSQYTLLLCDILSIYTTAI